jgi:hypothetical protein
LFLHRLPRDAEPTRESSPSGTSQRKQPYALGFIHTFWKQFDYEQSIRQRCHEQSSATQERDDITQGERTRLDQQRHEAQLHTFASEPQTRRAWLSDQLDDEHYGPNDGIIARGAVCEQYTARHDVERTYDCQRAQEPNDTVATDSAGSQKELRRNRADVFGGLTRQVRYLVFSRVDNICSHRGMIATCAWTTCHVQLSGRPSRIPPYPVFFFNDSDKFGDHLVPDLGVARFDQRPEKRFHVIWPPFRSCQEKFAEPSSGI